MSDGIARSIAPTEMHTPPDPVPRTAEHMIAEYKLAEIRAIVHESSAPGTYLDHLVGQINRIAGIVG
jgi:hypothetical protein